MSVAWVSNRMVSRTSWSFRFVYEPKKVLKMLCFVKCSSNFLKLWKHFKAVNKSIHCAAAFGSSKLQSSQMLPMFDFNDSFPVAFFVHIIYNSVCVSVCRSVQVVSVWLSVPVSLCLCMTVWLSLCPCLCLSLPLRYSLCLGCLSVSVPVSPLLSCLGCLSGFGVHLPTHCLLNILFKTSASSDRIYFLR